MFVVAPVFNGKPQFASDQSKMLASEFRKHEGKEIRIEIFRHHKLRSDDQNNYMWGVLYKYIMVETGYSKNEVHALMRSMFADKVHLKIGDKEVEVIPSTSTLTTVEMSEYWERVRKFAAEELSTDIPDPDGKSYKIKDSDFMPDVGRDAAGNIVRFSTGEVLATPQELKM